MKMRILSRKETGVIYALAGLILDMAKDHPDNPLIKQMKDEMGVDLLAEMEKLSKELPGNFLLLLDREGDETLGEPKIAEFPLTEYGQKDALKGLKGMKFPYRKEETGEQPE